MYILKITNTHADRDDLFIYEDIDFASVVRSFTTELLSQLHKNSDYDMVTVSGSLVDNYFCNGPFDLASVDMLDTEGTYPYAVFLERYQNAWSSIHSGIFTTDEKWYEYIINYYQSHVSE